MVKINSVKLTLTALLVYSVSNFAENCPPVELLNAAKKEDLNSRFVFITYQGIRYSFSNLSAIGNFSSFRNAVIESIPRDALDCNYSVTSDNKFVIVSAYTFNKPKKSGMNWTPRSSTGAETCFSTDVTQCRFTI